MKVRILGANGLHSSEIQAVSQMEKTFRDSWFAYAGLLIIDDQGSMDIDVLIIAHDRLLLVELKEWNGILEEIDGQWYLNGSSRGKSPYAIKRVHAIRIAKLLEKELKHKLGYFPLVEAHVVLCGSATPKRLSTGEQRFVHTLDEFLRLSLPEEYIKIVQDNDIPARLFIQQAKPRPNSDNCLPIFQTFFQGPRIKPKEFKFHHFLANREPWFIHRNGLYREFKGTHEEAAHEIALMRRWDFTQLGTGNATQEQWANIALRETRIVGYVNDRNNRIGEYLLRPRVPLGTADITEDTTELYEIRRTYARLDDYFNGEGRHLNEDFRLDIVRALLAPFSELHALGIGHRDIDGHNLWYAREQNSIVVSGFATAFFPEKGTLKDLRQHIQSTKIKLPEDVFKTEGDILDPFRQDVFMLAAVAHGICFPGCKLRRDDDIPIWHSPEIDPYNGRLDDWYTKAFSWNPTERFANASEMLSELNEIAQPESISAEDNIVVFDALMSGAFVKRNWSVFQLFVQYPPILGENPAADQKIKYRTITGEHEGYVKIWQHVRAERSQVGDNRRILRFRQLAEKFSEGNLPTPAVIDFGLLETGGLYLVTRIEPGQLWTDAIGQFTAEVDRLHLALLLVRTLNELHEQGLAHGDLHPENLLVTRPTATPPDSNKDASPFGLILLDMLDFGDQTEPFNLEYGPPNPAAADAEARDRYAVYRLVTHLLQPCSYAEISEELARGLSSPGEIPVALTPLEKVILSTFTPKQEIKPSTPKTIEFFWLNDSFPTTSVELEHDGDFYHFQCSWDKRDRDLLRCYLTSVSASLTIVIDPEQRQIRDVRFRPNIPLSDVVRSSRQAQDQLSDKIIIQRKTPDVHANRALLDLVLGLDSVLSLLEDRYAVHDEEAEQDLVATDSIRARDIWKALEETEAESLLTVEVAEDEIEEDYHGCILVHFINDSGKTLDFDVDDRVLVRKGHDDQDLAELDVTRTTPDVLALMPRRAKLPSQLKKGDTLQLESLRSKASRDRKKRALARVLDDTAAIPRLPDYFDMKTAPPPTILSDEPTPEQISRYSTTDKKLNEKQKEAFRRLAAFGPIGVLQGPPGTGKTSFVSMFIHYLFSELGARNVLLVGQSHTSVDNVAKKVRGVCSEHSTELSIVRIGNENMIATELLDAHTRALQRKMRHRFHREYDHRVSAFAARMSLPDTFVKDVAAVHRSVSPTLESLRKCSGDIERITGKPVLDADDQLTLERFMFERRKYEETLESLAYSRFSTDAPELISSNDFWGDLVKLLSEQHGISNPSACAKLTNVLRLSHEWLDVLKTGEANYDQFLVRTRQLVCGTLVGLGQKQLGIAETEFDWVIVDEAARAQASELMIAIQSGKRLLLVGDHRQLAPLYDKQHLKATAKRLGIATNAARITDFQRLFGTTQGITLDTQYRMCEPIGDLVSTCFYRDELEKLKTGRGASPEWYSELPSPWDVPVVWIDSGQGEEATGQEPVGTGFRNRYEVTVVLDLLMKLSQAPHLERISDCLTSEQRHAIGIITMYRAQRDLIEQELSKAEWAGSFRNLIKVDTVDSYQGQENPIIILSLVRDYLDKHQGFLVEDSRINVSISRAQERLVIVGACRMWRGVKRDTPLDRVHGFIQEKVSAMDARYLVVGADTLRG